MIQLGLMASHRLIQVPISQKIDISCEHSITILRLCWHPDSSGHSDKTWLDNYGGSSLFVGRCDACLHEAFSQVAAKVLPHILPEETVLNQGDICILRKHLEMKRYTESQSLNFMRCVVRKACSTQRAGKCLSQASLPSTPPE